MKNRVIFFAILSANLFFSSCSHKGTKSSYSSKSSKPSSGQPIKASSTTIVLPPTEIVSEKYEYIDARVKFIEGDDLEAALVLAKAEKKPIFLDFYADWCAPCKVMEDGVFHDYDVADFMNKNVINLRINIEKGRGAALKEKMFVGPLPTVLFLDPNGKELSRKEGIPLIADFKKLMKTATWKAKNQSGQP